jgi:hypothetical protein
MRWIRIFAVLAVPALLAGSACNSKSSKSSSSSSSSTPTTTAPKKTAAKGGVTVDLVITGQDPAVIKGTKGSCGVSQNETWGDYNFVAADYPGLGPNGVFSLESPNGVTRIAMMKNIVNGHVLTEEPEGSGMTFSDRFHKVTIDADLTRGESPPSDPNNEQSGLTKHIVTGHVAGTIVCN